MYSTFGEATIPAEPWESKIKGCVDARAKENSSE